jgi:hypothetical protein
MVVCLIALLIILAGLACWFLLRRRHHSGLSSLNKQMPDQPPDREAPAPKPTPDFLEELRRKDKFMNVESQKTGKAELDFQEISRKEKEIMARPPSSKP